MGRADIGGHAQTEQKADEGGRKVIHPGTTDKAGIAVEGELPGQPELFEGGHETVNDRLGVEISPVLIVYQHRGAAINHVEGFHQVHLLVVLFQPHRGHILEIGLPYFTRSRAGHSLMCRFMGTADPSMRIQNGPNSTAGPRDMHLPLLQFLIQPQIILDGYRTRGAL